VRILNGHFAAVTLEQTLERIFALIRTGRRGYLCTVNVAILMMMRGNPRLQRFVDGATLSVADGTPLVWASRILGQALPERVAGVDLVERLCERAALEGVGVYLLGATRPVVDAVAARMKGRFPELSLVGVQDGYFSAEEAEGRARAVRNSGAGVVIVGMGVPRQEYFIEEQWDNLGVSFAMGVGGSFEVLAGLRRRAPEILQRAGLEWAFRLIQEPRRLFKRYMVTNLQFVFHLARELILGH